MKCLPSRYRDRMTPTPEEAPGQRPVAADDGAADRARDRARQRALVQRGYDLVSHAYRSDDGRAHPASGEDSGRYQEWIDDLAALLPARARVVDLGCGNGVPGTLALTGHGLNVLGVDFSRVQLTRARRLVPAARFVRADMATFGLRPASVDAVTAFYSMIHLPLADQRALLARARDWLRPGGYLLVLVGAAFWTGTEEFHGTDMFWDHADTATYLRWCREARLTPRMHRFVPEGNSGHTLILATAG
jgi:SAM-dependent methyltransferase